MQLSCTVLTIFWMQTALGVSVLPQGLWRSFLSFSSYDLRTSYNTWNCHKECWKLSHRTQNAKCFLFLWSQVSGENIELNWDSKALMVDSLQEMLLSKRNSSPSEPTSLTQFHCFCCCFNSSLILLSLASSQQQLLSTACGNSWAEQLLDIKDRPASSLDKLPDDPTPHGRC